MNFIQLFSLLFFVHFGTSMPSYSNHVLMMDKIENKKSAAQARSDIVNLDQAPRDRWQTLVEQFDVSYFAQGIQAMLRTAFKSPELVAVAERIAGDLDRYISQPYSDEMRGLSAATGIPLGDVVLTNILYDFTAYANSSIQACTSIVSVDKTGHIIHGRNLDYVQPDFLKNLTIQVEFQREEKTVYTASSFVGYVGITTGSRHGAFSLSGNQRNYGTFWENLVSSLEGGQITFFAARKVLEESSDYKSALNQIINTPTDAPVYFILGGIRPNEGALVVRNGIDVALVKHFDNYFKHPWFLVETNYDPWMKPPESDNRREAAIKSMMAVGKDKVDADQLYKVLSTPPVLNEQTTFTAIMSAGDAKAYRTMIRFDGPSE